MTEGNPNNPDLLGIRPVAEAARDVTRTALGLLNRICLPAAEEFGYLLQDKVRGWRARNFISIMQKVEKKLAESKVPEGASAHPRIVHSILEQGTWVEDSAVQDMWAGLLSSSCTEEGDDDSNLIFVNLLGNMTKLQAKVMRYACEQAGKVTTPAGLIHPQWFLVPLEKLCEVAQEKDVQRLDRELDSLRGMSLIEGGFSPHDQSVVNLTPSPLALHMYVRCQGSRLSPTEFFEPSVPPAAPPSQSP
jgi:hypothetical protein